MSELLNNQELAERLKHGPSYLIVGQAWLRGGSGRDIFLEQFLKKFDHPTDAGLGYSAFFETTASHNREEAVAWLQDRCAFIPIPDAFETVSEFAWNGVVTSAVDDVITRALRKPWRDVQKVTSKQYQPGGPRSRTKLHVWFLFGNVAAPDPDGWSILLPGRTKATY